MMCMYCFCDDSIFLRGFYCLYAISVFLCVSNFLILKSIFSIIIPYTFESIFLFQGVL